MKIKAFSLDVFACFCLTSVCFITRLVHFFLSSGTTADLFFPPPNKLSPVISVNWLWITEVILRVSEVAGAAECLLAFALDICLHVCAP